MKRLIRLLITIPLLSMIIAFIGVGLDSLIVFSIGLFVLPVVLIILFNKIDIMNIKGKKLYSGLLLGLVLSVIFVGVSPLTQSEAPSDKQDALNDVIVHEEIDNKSENDIKDETTVVDENKTEDDKLEEQGNDKKEEDNLKQEGNDKKEESGNQTDSQNNKDTINDKNEPSKQNTSSNSMFDGYTMIEVDGGDLSGYRKANVVVDIGYGDREYWAFTNKYGQVVKVYAKEIILQRDSEPLTSQGRYYADEAKVPGTEKENLDEGHIIADSLGGVSNAYNITPQDSTLNRYGDQAYMEKVIRDAGGCSDFTCIITYPNTKTQIPSHYKFTYNLRGNLITDSFPNANPEGSNTSSESGNISSESNIKDKNDNKENTNITTNDSNTVWIANKKSKIYHSHSGCSGMKSPVSISLKEIETREGTRACKKCY